jgi:hypothetical protein
MRSSQGLRLVDSIQRLILCLRTPYHQGRCGVKRKPYSTKSFGKTVDKRLILGQLEKAGL